MKSNFASCAAERGLSLVEVLIVVAIMSLVAGGVAIAAFKQWEYAETKTAKTSARNLRRVAQAWRAVNETDACPDVEEMLASGDLDEDSSRTDPWGSPWRIACDGPRVSVASAGPDGVEGTDDDVRVPPV